MIEKIPLTEAKFQKRYKGIALTKAEEIALLKINEIIDYLYDHSKTERRSLSEDL